MSKLARSSMYFAALVAVLAVGCVADDLDPLDDQDAGFTAGGKADGSLEAGSPQARAVLALVNDLEVGFEELDDDARLNRRAAARILSHRNGADGASGGGDDDLFDSLQELDDVPYVGPYALGQLLQYATAQGYLDAETAKRVEVIFSPMPWAQSHNARVAQLIDDAEHSIDIAMYSYSDAGIAAALQRATARGVKFRFLFETGAKDRKKIGAELLNSKSGRLEAMGIDVRWVNKIMHHKFMIVDGPRDQVSRIDTATVATGSANWSAGAATRYDENTVFFTGYRELTMRLQKEFDHLWDHSRDVAVDASLAYERSALSMDELGIADEASTHAYFTSENFTTRGDTFRIKRGSNEVSDALVRAIGAAERSIHIASGHMRSRPIAEALMSAAAAKPELDIKIYLDGQEYVSRWYHDSQLAKLELCLEQASTEIQRANCLQKGFYFGYQAGQSGIDVRYKYYAYRWHYSYAIQMHHKYTIIDGDELWTGSYNHSDNAEHNTFENVLRFSGPEFVPLIAAFEANFSSMWNTGDGLYELLSDQVETADRVPLVFDSMALSWSQISTLKARLRANCADINSDDFRARPERHWSCAR